MGNRRTPPDIERQTLRRRHIVASDEDIGETPGAASLPEALGVFAATGSRRPAAGEGRDTRSVRGFGFDARRRQSRRLPEHRRRILGAIRGNRGAGHTETGGAQVS